ncbi:MAG TPA: site-specific DNA-methyltransferase [Tepidisphaeraceae bacterium]|nr:site-specific DNA-methyltransferase [Tepidisphaeraceae bacterium]
MEKLIQQDALRFLSELPDDSVDVAVSSPPYFIGKEYDTSCNVSDFVTLHERLSEQLIRVVKPGGSICWQVGSHVRDNIVIPLDAIVYSSFSKSEEIQLRNRIVWTFGHGAHCSRRFSGRHETILWFTKGDNYYFELDAVRVPQKYPGKKHYKGRNQGKLSGNPLGKNPGDVWDIPNVKAGHVEKTNHPCQFPVALAQRLVKALCPPNGLVIDPYLGSGSTGIAAIAEGRQFMGCDIESKYVKIARARFKDFQNGNLKLRPLDQPIHIPSKNDSVAKMPLQWLEGQKTHSVSV